MKFFILLTTLLMALTSKASIKMDALRYPTNFFWETREKLLKITIKKESSGKYLKHNLIQLITLSEIASDVKDYSSEFSLQVQNTISDKDVLSGEDLDIMSKLVDTYQLISLKFLHLIVTYSPQNPYDDYEDLFQKVSPFRKKANLIWYTAQMELFDHYIQTYDDYWKNGESRRVIKNIFLSKKNVEGLTQIANSLLKRDNRLRLKVLTKKLKRDWKSVFVNTNIDLQLINRILLKNDSVKEIVVRRYGVLWTYNFTDSFVSLIGKITNFFSKVFGNVVGAIRWRHGYLHDDPVIFKHLIQKLRPLDILVEKTPFALTDTFIPGHFGHVAIWLGTEEQLKKYGLWDSPAIQPYQETIRQGYTIFEAVREGVRFTTLEDFLEIDEIGIIRDPSLVNDKQMADLTFERAFQHIGKEYDFNFDVSTTDKIVCSELIFLALGHINWPTEYVWGRNTISPDNVSELIFYQNAPISLQYYLVSKKKGSARSLNLNKFAQNLNYEQDLINSTQSNPIYHKKIDSCRTVRVKSPFTGEVTTKRVCGVKYKKYYYDVFNKGSSWQKWYAQPNDLK